MWKTVALHNPTKIKIQIFLFWHTIQRSYQFTVNYLAGMYFLSVFFQFFPINKYGGGKNALNRSRADFTVHEKSIFVIFGPNLELWSVFEKSANW